MRGNGFLRSVAAFCRKRRALGAVADDAGATTPEKTNAAALKTGVEQRLRETGAPAGDWTDHAFRAGRWAKDIRKSAGLASTETDWPDHARRLGKAARRAYKNRSSD